MIQGCCLADIFCFSVWERGAIWYYNAPSFQFTATAWREMISSASRRKPTPRTLSLGLTMILLPMATCQWLANGKRCAELEHDGRFPLSLAGVQTLRNQAIFRWLGFVLPLWLDSRHAQLQRITDVCPGLKRGQ